MKTIHNSDIRFELNPRIIYVSDFEMTFYTVNKRDFSFRKTSADVQEVEVSGDTKYYLDLDWSLLSYVGKGVLNYQCINNIADPSFPDGEYNQLVEKTTDYYIDTFKVEPDSTDKSITELLGEEVEARIAGDAALSGAVDTEVEARIAADEAISGAVDTALSGKQDTLIAGENIYISGNVISAIGGDLSNYYTKSEVDSALSGKADSDDVYTKGETSGKTEISTALDGKLDVTAYTPTDLSNYYTKSETSGKTEISTALATKLDTTAYTPTDLSNYYTKSETSGKTEIATALSAKADSSDVYLKSETSGKTEISTALASKLDTTAYTPTDLSNYYTKSETSGKTEIATALSAKADSTAVIQAIDQAVSGKADSDDVYLKSETSGATEISTALSTKLDTTAYTPTDLSNYYTKGETSGATELSTAFNAKLDTTAYTPTDLSNYYTKSETSGKTEIQTALSGKQETLVSGTNIKTINNESILGSGNIDIQGGGSSINVVQTTGTSTGDVMSQDAVTTALSTKLDTTAYTPTDLSNYYTKSETSGATEISTALAAKQGTLSAGTGVDITNDVISVTGGTGGKAVSGGTNISITTGETADTINCTLPISGDSKGIYTTSSYPFNGNGYKAGNVVFGNNNVIDKGGSSTQTTYNLMFGRNNNIGNGSWAGDNHGNLVGGSYNKVYAKISDACVLGYANEVRNLYESAFGLCNNSVSGSTNADNTLFSVGNGTSSSARHNAFEIRKNGDIYITSGGTDIKLQDNLGGGGSSINVVQTTGTSSGDVMSQDAVTTALSTKLDTTAYTPTDLSNYYTKSETSGKTEISTALAAKQGTLTAGTGIDITNDVISVTGGGGSSVTVVQTTGTSTSDVMSQNAVTTALSGKQETLTSGTNIKTINGNSILGSGNITIQGGSGNNVVELTQAEYDALTTKDPDTFYVITDATPADLTNYYTKSETSGATEISTALASKQGTLVSGTNIKTINNESILGSGNITIQGGGKAIEAGRGISITTGETADTVSFNLPISAATGYNALIFGDPYNNRATGSLSVAIGNATSATTTYGFACGDHTICDAQGGFVCGKRTITNNYFEFGSGFYNKSNKGSTDADNTLFSVGDGTSTEARHNAFEIRRNGDIYITSGGTDIKLQDNLGGGGSSINVVQTTGTSSGDVMSQDAVTTALATKADAANLGGLKLQQITQSAYDALTTKDASTLYVIVN